jgi:hypothetical protein
MRFHFGLGVGHVYSHYRSTQVETREGDAVRAGTIGDGQDTTNVAIDEVEVADEVVHENSDEDQDAYEDEEDGTNGGLTLEQRFSSSDESLLSQFGQMYGSDFELDYEN